MATRVIAPAHKADDRLPDSTFLGVSIPSAGWFAFDESDIRRCLHGEVDKGRPYQRRGAVRDLRADKGGQRLIALVQGTRLRPYRVFVDIGKGNPVALSARCSCPVAWNCKHAAAVLLEALANPPAIEGTGEDVLPGPVGGWLHQLRQAAHPGVAPDELAYRLDHPPRPGLLFLLDLRVVRVLKSGGWGADRPLPAGQLQSPTAKYFRPADRAVLQLLRDGLGRLPPPLPEDPDLIDLLLRRMVASGRCCWQDLAATPLALGSPRHGRLAWRRGSDGRQTVDVELDDGSAIALPSASPWYVDPAEHVVGPITLDIARPLVRIALSAPPVTTAQAAALGALIERNLPDLALPRPRTDLVEEIREEPPVPTLLLANRQRRRNYWEMWTKDLEEGVDVALLGYLYGDTLIAAEEAPREQRKVEDGRIVVRRRDLAAEQAAQDRLEALGLRAVDTFAAAGGEAGRIPFGFPDGHADWPNFVYEAVPQLEREGWRIDVEDTFRYRVVDGGGEWTAEVEEGGGWWFSLDLGIEIDGERVALLPVLTALLARLRDGSTAGTWHCRSTAPRRSCRPWSSSITREAFPPPARSRSRPALRPASPQSRKRRGCAGSAVSGCAHWSTVCRVFRGSTRSSRRPRCRPSCGLIRRRGSIGCNSCAPTSSAAFSPMIWGSARPCRHWPTCSSRSARAVSTGRASWSARRVWCRTGSPKRHAWRPNCVSSHCTGPIARSISPRSAMPIWW